MLWDEVYECIKNREKVLEIGCGIGDFVRFLASKGLDVTGIDPYAENQSEKGYHIRRAYAEELPFEDESFDAVVSVRTLHHTDAKRTLKEAYRVLKNDGMICISDWKKGADTGIKEEYFSPEELRKMLMEAGFNNIGFFPCSDERMMLVWGRK